MSIDQGVTDMRHKLASHQIDKQHEKLIRWLSTCDPSSNHHAAYKKHQPQTGEWFTRRDDFEQWKHAQNSLIWLYGIRKYDLYLFLRKEIAS